MFFKRAFQGTIQFFILGFLLSSSFHALSNDKAKQGLVPSDYFDFVFVSDPQVSPNGQNIAFVKTTVNVDASGRNRHIYISSNKQTPQRFTQGNADRSPRWSPNGETLAFVRNVDDIAQVFSIPVNGGEAVQITHFEHESMSEFSWFPDGKRFLLTMSTSPKAESGAVDTKNKAKRAAPDILVVKDALYKANGQGYLDDTREHLFTYTIASQSLNQLTFGQDHNINNASLSADGTYVVYSANKTGLYYEGDSNEDIYRLNIDNGKSVALSTHAYAQYQPRLSNNNKAIAYLHNEADFEQTDLWVMANNGSKPKNLTATFDRIASAAIWGAADKNLYFLASDNGAVRLFEANVESAKVRQVLSENMTISNLALSPNGEYAVFTMEDSTHLPELYKYNMRSKKLLQLTYFNTALLAQRKLSPATDIWFKNDKGMDVQGFLHKPINYVKGQKYPLVLNIKGGPGGMWGHRWFHENQMYAAKGYAVVYVNYRGSDGYGDAHSKAVVQDYGGADYADNMQFLDTVLAQNKWIDDKQLYLTGGSHGGFLTNWITTQTKRFKAAVTQRSVSSWISEAGTQEFTPQDMNSEFGGNLWENFDYYWNRSPLQFANQVTTPTLIIHSTDDMITPIGQGQEWFYALKANNVPTEMVIFKGETHSLSRSGKPTNLVERLDRIIQWFEQYSD